MIRKQFFTLILLVGMLFTQPVQQAAAADTCNHVGFVADVTIPDGSILAPGATFIKTWRLKNIGQCTWTTNYALVFHSGEQMEAPSSINLSLDIAPGQMVDVSLPLTAPLANGHYRGNWLLRTENQESFGMGAMASDPFWVDIQVLDNTQVAFDFVARAPEAQWRSGVGKLSYPGIGGDNNGYARVVDRPRLENDALDVGPGLLMMPQNKYNGYIQGTFPEYTVQPGDHLQTVVNCEFGASRCNVIFRIDYMLPNGLVKKYKTYGEKTDGRFLRVDLDLSALAGQRVRFILMVLANGFATDDRAIWGTPRIIHAPGLIPPTITVTPPGPLPPTPGPTAVTTPTPPPASDCDRITFVADGSIPDGTVLTPGSPIHKIWRLKNSGTCEWTSAYNLVFHNGDRMHASESVALPVSVAPGQAIDLSIDMTAPAVAGRYRGYWLLRNAEGALFGLGTDGTLKPFWVDINVIDPLDTNTGYDFTARACDAQWRSGAGPLPCPGSDGDLNGFVLKLEAPRLEDGSLSSLPGLVTFPQFKYNGYIQGTYPLYTVQPGDRFQATVGCEFGAQCYVTFRLDFASTGGWARSLWSWREMNQGRQNNIDVDLGPLAGYSGRFTLTLLSTGYASGDRALWAAPRIFRQGGVPPEDTPTPLPPTETLTNTATPSDWPTYTNGTFGFEFKYPPQSEINRQEFNSLTLTLPPVSPPGTTLVRKYFDMAVLDASGCYNPAIEPPEDYQLVVLNGITFVRRAGHDLTMGNIRDWERYSTVKGNTCVDFFFILHSGNPANYDPPRPVVDSAAETAIYQKLLATFIWLPATPTATANDWLTYTNPTFGFEFKYPPQSQTTHEDFNSISMKLPQVSPAGTNLLDKYFDMRVSSGACSQPPDYTITITPEPVTLTLNGLTFERWAASDGGMSHFHDWEQYSIQQGNNCITFRFVLYSVAQGVFDPTPPAFDGPAESVIYRQILSTFRWLPATPTPTLTPTDTATPTGTLTPTISPASLIGPYAVVSVAPGSSLSIHASPGTSHPVVGSFTSNATNIMRTGASQPVDGVQWVEVLRNDGGRGWVEARSLAEYVSSATFCGDARILPMVAQLQQAMEQSDGSLFSSLVSPVHGVNVRFWYALPGLTFDRGQAVGLFTDLTEYNWGAGPSGVDDIIIFRDFIPFRVRDVLAADNRLSACDTPSWTWEASDPWPPAFANIHYYAFHRPSQAGVQIPPRTWLIGFEYVDGQPYLFALIHFFPQ